MKKENNDSIILPLRKFVEEVPEFIELRPLRTNLDFFIENIDDDLHKSAC